MLLLALLICVVFIFLFFLAEICKKMLSSGVEDKEQPPRALQALLDSWVVFSALT